MSINRKKLIEELLEDVRTSFRRVTIAARSDMNGHTIPRSQAIVMHIVNANPGISVKGVATTLDISPSAATQLVDSLVKDGAVIRLASEHDRRVVCLELSKQGKTRLIKYKSFQIARFNTIMDVLSDSEITELNRLHNKIHTEMSVHPSMKLFTPKLTVKHN